jgi:hypothetical protein
MKTPSGLRRLRDRLTGRCARRPLRRLVGRPALAGPVPAPPPEPGPVSGLRELPPGADPDDYEWVPDNSQADPP